MVKKLEDHPLSRPLSLEEKQRIRRYYDLKEKFHNPYLPDKGRHQAMQEFRRVYPEMKDLRVYVDFFLRMAFLKLRKRLDSGESLESILSPTQTKESDDQE